MRTLHRLAHCERAATAAEFALVLTLLLTLMFGIIDAGRYMWEANQAEKATQVGARMAAVTGAISPDLIEANFASVDVKPGELIPADAMGTVVCTSEGCTCETTSGGPPCPFDDGDVDTDTLEDVILPRMQAIKANLTADNIVVSYSGSGFGYAGSPPTKGGGSVAETMEVSPLITVSLRDVEFTPISSFLLASIALPSAATTVVAEDLSGIYSN